jgi:hypothetical protein
MNIKKILTGVMGLALIGTMVSLNVSNTYAVTQSTDISSSNSTITGDDAATAAATGAVLGLYGVSFVFYACCYGGIVIFGIVDFVIKILSAIHCAEHAPEKDKLTWILLIIFIPFVNFYYYFTKRKEWDSK